MTTSRKSVVIGPVQKGGVYAGAHPLLSRIQMPLIRPAPPRGEQDSKRSSSSFISRDVAIAGQSDASGITLAMVQGLMKSCDDHEQCLTFGGMKGYTIVMLNGMVLLDHYLSGMIN